jgi:AraC family transcriptional regulator
MNPDDAVTLQVRNRLTADTLRTSHDWGVLGAEHVAMLRPRQLDFNLHGGRHYLALLDFYRGDGETFADELPRSTLRDVRGKLVFIPAGCRLQGWSQPAGTPIAFTAAYLDPRVCSQLGTDQSQLSPMLHVEHPLLIQLMLQLDRMLSQPEMYSRMYAESFAVVLMSEIMICQATELSRGRSPERLPPLKGGLASWQHRAVRDYIEENLPQEISLIELAAIARLSPYHFCRAFKEAVGEPPHRYQMGRRVERAKALLTDPSLTITHIATAVGYSSPSRFTTLFRQVTDYAPRDYRKKMV